MSEMTSAKNIVKRLPRGIYACFAMSVALALTYHSARNSSKKKTKKTNEQRKQQKTPQPSEGKEALEQRRSRA